MYTKHYFDLCTIHVYIGFLNRVQSCVLARDLIPKIYNKEFEIEIMNNVRICQFWEQEEMGFLKGIILDLIVLNAFSKRNMNGPGINVKIKFKKWSIEVANVQIKTVFKKISILQI